MATNKLTEVAGLVAQAVMGAKVKDKDGNAKTVKPTGDDNLLDLTDIVAGGSTGGNTGGSTDPDHPAAGADYYAGSLADGEITERYLLYQRDESVAEQTESQTVTLLRDVGTRFNMAGDGATFLVHLQRTAMDKGAKGAITDIQLNYDSTNVAKDGYFTTTSPYPIYIKASDLATKKTLAIPINGIGENISGKNVKAPQLNVTFNDNGTMTLESVTGYDNDGNSTGATGANYDVVVDVIATFSTQQAVAQLPAAVNLFSGNATSDIALSGISDYFENSMDGIQITFDDYGYHYKNNRDDYRIKNSELGIPKTLKIKKDYLINNYKYNLKKVALKNAKLPYEYRYNGDGKWVSGKSVTVIDNDIHFIINKSSLKYSSNFSMLIYVGVETNYPFSVSVLKVNPYKD